MDNQILRFIAFFKFSFLSLSTAILVPILFQVLDRGTAALVNSLWFILYCLLLLYFVPKRSLDEKFIGVLSFIFLLFFALPIFFLRVYYWGENFSSLSLFGISSSYFHQGSRWVFLCLAIGLLIWEIKNLFAATKKRCKQRA